MSIPRTDSASSPLVTVLIAVHNGERTIQRTLEAVFAQTFADYELLVVDDGSSDATPRILKTVRDPRLKVLTNHRNLGLTRSLHWGVLEAKGDYVARIDDGLDRVSAGWLAKCVAPLEEDESIVLSGPRTRSWRESGEFYESSQPEDSDILRWIFLLHNCVAHAGSVFRRVVNGEIQNYDLAFAMSQDYELWSRLARVGRVHVVPEYLVDIVYTRTGLTDRKKSEQEAYAAKVRARQQNWLLGTNKITPELANAAAGVYWRWPETTGRDALRGSRVLQKLRKAYLDRFGTASMRRHLQERFFGHSRWLFHRAEDEMRYGKGDALGYLMAAWTMGPSQFANHRSLEIGLQILRRRVAK